MTEHDIIDWIGNEIYDRDFCADMTYDDENPTLEIEDNEGNRFEITVKKIG